MIFTNGEALFMLYSASYSSSQLPFIPETIINFCGFFPINVFIFYYVQCVCIFIYTQTNMVYVVPFYKLKQKFCFISKNKTL